MPNTNGILPCVIAISLCPNLPPPPASLRALPDSCSYSSAVSALNGSASRAFLAVLAKFSMTRCPAGYGKLTGTRKPLRFLMRLILSSRCVDGPGGAMLTHEDYRQLAERCALLA